jgi:hypothetical protein
MAGAPMNDPLTSSSQLGFGAMTETNLVLEHPYPDFADIS